MENKASEKGKKKNCLMQECIKTTEYNNYVCEGKLDVLLRFSTKIISPASQ